ncbi:hypothetical protein CJ030_MR0G007198 [Morella rubra]|uniref:TMV resistance protein N n=1 Tax=Morella rubra TaxID=262757 RepID=A0A6A1UKE9_9ROSI|nr:hypothetical protein CJ030_MR0G007198 [Morella rubra]
MSTMDDEISRPAESLPLPPPIAFPSLKWLDVGSSAISKSDLFTQFNFSSTLWFFSLSGSNIISVPSSISRYVGLTHLCLNNCKQLQEIPQLPPKLELSKIWQFNTSDLQELKWVELTGCHKMVVDVENSVPKALLFQGYPTGHDSVYKDSTFSVIFPGIYKHDQEVATYAADMLHEDVDVNFEVPEKEQGNSGHLWMKYNFQRSTRVAMIKTENPNGAPSMGIQ